MLKKEHSHSLRFVRISKLQVISTIMTPTRLLMIDTVTECGGERRLQKVRRINMSIIMKELLRMMMDMCITTVAGRVRLFPCRTETITMNFQGEPLMMTDTLIPTGVLPVKGLRKIRASCCQAIDSCTQ